MTNAEPLPPLLCAFLHDAIDGKTFRHRDHVEVAFHILKRHDFMQSAAVYVGSLRAIARRAGNPKAFHLTITLAYLSLVSERSADFEDFDAFVRANPDLLDKAMLERWYAPQRLYSDLARNTFLLPRVAQ